MRRLDHAYSHRPPNRTSSDGRYPRPRLRLRQNPIPRRTYRSEQQATIRSHRPEDQNRLVRGPEAARRDSSDQNQTGKRGGTDHQKVPDERWEKHGGCFHRKAQRRTTDYLCPRNLAQATLSNRAPCLSPLSDYAWQRSLCRQLQWKGDLLGCAIGFCRFLI